MNLADPPLTEQNRLISDGTSKQHRRWVMKSPTKGAFSKKLFLLCLQIGSIVQRCPCVTVNV